MKLFTVGPVEMYDEQMEIGGQQVPYFRNQEFSNVVFDCKESLKQLIHAKEEDDVIFLTASGTAAMEATIMNCFTSKDKLVVINGGTFGQRFVELCQIHEIPFYEVKVAENETLTIDMLPNGNDYTGLLVNIHETSNGQLYDIEMLSQYCQEHQLYFVVDAISSMFADHFDFSQYHVDVAIVSSQKALSLAPGLAIVVVSEKMIEERIRVIDSKIMYLDFKSHLLNGKRGQTPFTPAVRLIYELQNRLHQLLEIGIDKQVENTKILADDFRERLVSIGLKYPTYPISNAETVVFFPDLNADIVAQRLKDEYGYIVNPSGGVKAKQMFRVAHIGCHNLEDNRLIIDAMKTILNKD